MESDSDLVETVVKQSRRPRKAVVEQEKEVIVAKTPSERKKRVMTQEQLDELARRRVKALEVLTAQRRAKAEAKAKQQAEESEVRQKVEEQRLDRAPRVKQIDDNVTSLKAEIEALKKMIKPSAEPVPVPAVAKPQLTGHELLDTLFFSKR